MSVIKEKTCDSNDFHPITSSNGTYTGPIKNIS